MEETLFNPNGKPIAYLDSKNLIYGFNGKHLGCYEEGI